MLNEFMTNTVELNARLNSGQRLDVTKVIAARYTIATPWGNINKTLSDMAIEYVDHLGDNYLVVTLTPEESNQSGEYPHQLEVSFDGSTYVGCVLRPDALTFKPNISRNY